MFMREDLFNEERVASLVKTLERLSGMKDASVEEKLQDQNVKELDGIIYVPFDEVLIESGYFCCCASTDFILTDSNFEGLSYETKRFILLHEVGHQVNGHLEQLASTSTEEIVEQRMEYIEAGQVMPIELEADAYTLNFMTKEQAYNALEELQSAMDENFVDDQGEVSLRKEFILR